MRNTRSLVVFVLLLFIVAAPLVQPALGSIQPLSAATFPVGTYVVPMDDKQSDRIHVYGFIHEFLRNNSNNNLARVIEPPDITLQTALTPAGGLYQGGPFLIESSFTSAVNLMLSNSTFSKVTVTKLTAPFTSNKVFFVRNPTKILVISDRIWGNTYLTLNQMGISYKQVTTAQVMANASMINPYTLIVLDSPGWYGTPEKFDPAHAQQIEAVYNTIRLRVETGAEAMFTDAAILDMNSTFPGYVQLGLIGESGSWQSTIYNPPKGFDPEFPSQYYAPSPNPNSVRIFTEEGAGHWVPTGVQSAHTSDVRVLMDTVNYGVPSKHAILALYFPFGNGIVEGLALQPYEQLYPTYADVKGYYSVYQMYGNKFVEGLQPDFTLTGTPSTQPVAQGSTATYSITVNSLNGFSSTVNLQVTAGLPPGTQASIVPSAVVPSPGGSVVATLTIPTSLSTPTGAYNLTITGSSGLPLITHSIVLGLTVVSAPADFIINVSPSLLITNQASCGNFTVTVTSRGNFSAPVNLTLSSSPPLQHVTWKYVPNPVTPPIGQTVVSILTICTQSNTPPGNYTITIVATGGGLTHTTTATLRVPTPVVPSINPLIILLIIGMLLLALGLALLAFLLSRRGPTRRLRAVPAPIPVPVVRVMPRAAYVLPLPTIRCRYCGRIMPLTSVYCPYCGRPQVILAPPPRLVARRRLSRNGLIGMILTIISGILVLLNAAALLSPTFYAVWSSIFFWLPALGPPSYAFAIGMIIGLVLISGAIIMALGHGALADVIVFPFAVFSLIIGGGFVAGFILGVLGGIFGALRREP